MMIIIVFYWLVCGFATWKLPSSSYGFMDLFISFVLGGFIIPARAVTKLVK